MHLVVHEMGQLEDVDLADRHLLMEGLARAPVAEERLARGGQARLRQVSADLALGGAVEYRARHPHPESLGGPAEMGLEDLSDVHARRHPERVQHDLHRRPVGKVRHVFLGEHPGDDPLVAVAARHLVADRELALDGHVDLDHLDDAGRQVVAAAEPADALLQHAVEEGDLVVRQLLDALDGDGEPVVLLDLDLLQLVPGEVLQLRSVDLVALLGDPVLLDRVDEVLR